MNQQVKSYKDLIVWQKAMRLAKLVYELTRLLPAEEKFGLTSQMRRAAVSVPSNIAEGHARHTSGEFILFISHAEGSLAELETQVILAIDLGFCSADETKSIQALLTEVQKMSGALRRSLTPNP